MKDTGFASVIWRKSTHSGGNSGQCVEVAALPGTVGIRDSKNPHRPALAVNPRAFGRLLHEIKMT
ncbi:DUF397 domain-containing protein [Actinocorallia populi]|uniref:DUF397 domain-containing protein n=1 Tax=Actinocorallia populi TaxID=2079200 RepID=UPI000D08786A|nr:DUF397 domain-containing protein [Actinocorallia populi]